MRLWLRPEVPAPVSVWTVLGTWSTIGECERYEKPLFLSDESRVWYEGTSCTQEQREGYIQYD
jgi:hypothetical protein